MPLDFCSLFGEKIPSNVYLRIRTGDVWCCVHDRENACISNVGLMMGFFDVKPYNVFLLEYREDGYFHVQICNGDTVKIDYPLRTIPFKKPSLVGAEIRANFSSTE